MNRRNQGQHGQSRKQFNSQNFDDQNYEGKTLRSSNERGNYSGMMNSSRWDEDADPGFMGSSDYRETDYELAGSTYRNSKRPSQKMGPYEEYEANDRSRQPSRHSSLDEDRHSDRSRPSERQGSSSERFGYPSSMNSWTHSERPWSAGEQWPADTNSQYGTPQTRGFFGKGPKGYRRSDDRIKEEVCETLARHPRIDASDIEVKVEEACVTLSGTVDSKEIKRAAELAIENLSGVDDVKNELRVKRADDSILASSSSSKSSTPISKGPSRL